MAPKATLEELRAAAQDRDLVERVEAAAAEAQVGNPGWASANMARLVAMPITAEGDTLASVHAYAVGSYTPPPRPGKDAAKITDKHVRDAVAALLAADKEAAAQAAGTAPAGA